MSWCFHQTIENGNGNARLQCCVGKIELHRRDRTPDSSDPIMIFCYARKRKLMSKTVGGEQREDFF